jgi:chromosomal replication initiator protein
MRVIVYASMNSSDITRQTAAKALSDVFTQTELNLTMDDVLRVTARHYEIAPDDLKSKGRRHELVVPRQVAMYLIRELTPHSYPEIGQFFSGRDHSTVLYAVQKIAEQVEYDRTLGEIIRGLKGDLIG